MSTDSPAPSAPLQKIEARCNAVIRAGAALRQIVVDEQNRDALANAPTLRGALPLPDARKGPVRLIEIDGVDINACGGTHLRSTAELQVGADQLLHPPPFLHPLRSLRRVGSVVVGTWC